jgi:deoxyhypusine synthase
VEGPRSDAEGHKIDKMEQIALQKVQMEAESRKIMLDAAMRLPVRGGLEESYNMVNDEQIRQGEARRLGGTFPQQQQVELTDKSLKPVLDRLDKMFQKLEDKLQTGVPVKVS